MEAGLRSLSTRQDLSTADVTDDEICCGKGRLTDYLLRSGAPYENAVLMEKYSSYQGRF